MRCDEVLTITDDEWTAICDETNDIEYKCTPCGSTAWIGLRDLVGCDCSACQGQRDT